MYSVEAAAVLSKIDGAHEVIHSFESPLLHCVAGPWSLAWGTFYLFYFSHPLVATSHKSLRKFVLIDESNDMDDPQRRRGVALALPFVVGPLVSALGT